MDWRQIPNDLVDRTERAAKADAWAAKARARAADIWAQQQRAAAEEVVRPFLPVMGQRPASAIDPTGVGTARADEGPYPGSLPPGPEQGPDPRRVPRGSAADPTDLRNFDPARAQWGGDLNLQGEAARLSGQPFVEPPPSMETLEGRLGAMDTAGAMTRTMLAGRSPGDTRFAPRGAELAGNLGVPEGPLREGAGTLIEIATDPTNYLAAAGAVRGAARGAVAAELGQLVAGGVGAGVGGQVFGEGARQLGLSPEVGQTLGMLSGALIGASSVRDPDVSVGVTPGARRAKSSKPIPAAEMKFANQTTRPVDDVIAALVNRVRYAIATDDSRPSLAGVGVTVKGGQVTVGAADGFRLATATAPYSGDEFTDIVDVGMGGSGQFPNYAQIIPRPGDTRWIDGIDSKQFKEAVQKAAAASVKAQQDQSAAAGEVGKGIPIVRVEFENGALRVSGSKAGSEGETVLQVGGEGKGVVAFNPRYMTDAIDSEVRSGANTISLGVTTPASPLVVRGVGSDGTTHVIMPMYVAPDRGGTPPKISPREELRLSRERIAVAEKEYVKAERALARGETANRTAALELAGRRLEEARRRENAALRLVDEEEAALDARIARRNILTGQLTREQIATAYQAMTPEEKGEVLTRARDLARMTHLTANQIPSQEAARYLINVAEGHAPPLPRAGTRTTRPPSTPDPVPPSRPEPPRAPERAPVQEPEDVMMRRVNAIMSQLRKTSMPQLWAGPRGYQKLTDDLAGAEEDLANLSPSGNTRADLRRRRELEEAVATLRENIAAADVYRELGGKVLRPDAEDVIRRRLTAEPRLATGAASRDMSETEAAHSALIKSRDRLKRQITRAKEDDPRLPGWYQELDDVETQVTRSSWSLQDAYAASRGTAAARSEPAVVEPPRVEAPPAAASPPPPVEPPPPTALTPPPPEEPRAARGGRGRKPPVVPPAALTPPPPEDAPLPLPSGPHGGRPGPKAQFAEPVSWTPPAREAAVEAGIPPDRYARMEERARAAQEAIQRNRFSQPTPADTDNLARVRLAIAPERLSMRERVDNMIGHLRRGLGDPNYDLRPLARAAGKDPAEAAWAEWKRVPGFIGASDAIRHRDVEPLLDELSGDEISRLRELMVLRSAQDRSAIGNVRLPGGVEGAAGVTRALRQLEKDMGPERFRFVDAVASRLNAANRKYVLEALRDEGFYDAQTAAKIAADHPHWVPFTREEYLDVGGQGSGRGAVASGGLKEMTEGGSDLRLSDPLGRWSAAFGAAQHRIFRNRAARVTVDELKAVYPEQVQVYEWDEAQKLQSRGQIRSITPNNSISFFSPDKPGVRQVAVNVPEEIGRIANAVESETARPAIIRWIAMLSSPLRTGATKFSATFALVTNPIRDTLTTIAKEGVDTLRFYPEAFREAATRGARWEAAAEAGALTGSVADSAIRTTPYDKMILDIARNGGRLAEAQNEWERLGQWFARKTQPIARLSEVIEQTPRLAVMLKAMEPDGKVVPLKTVTRMRDVTVDFGQIGNWIVPFQGIIPFINPAVQGAWNAAQWAKNNPKRAAAVVAVAQMPSVAAHVWNSQFESAESIEAYHTERHWVFIVGEVDAPPNPERPNEPARKMPILFTIPKPIPFVGATAPMESALRLTTAAQDTWPQQALAEMWYAAQGAAMGFSPVDIRRPEALLPPALSTWIATASNRDWFRDRDIVPESEMGRPRGEQFGPDQSRVNVALGRALDISPRLIEYWQRGLAGDVPMQLAFIPEMILKAAGYNPEPVGAAFETERTTTEDVLRAPVVRGVARVARPNPSADPVGAGDLAQREYAKVILGIPEARRLGVSIEGIGAVAGTGDGTVQLTPEERIRAMKVLGESIEGKIAAAVAKRGYQRVSDEEKRRVLNKVVSEARQAAVKSVTAKETRQRIIEQSRIPARTREATTPTATVRNRGGTRLRDLLGVG